jgi:hypothetical protein
MPNRLALDRKGVTLFYTRPNLPATGLDLADLEGGGSCPAQFFGHTVDGRAVYIRYPGGRFTVECSDAHEARPARVLIDANIGPWLHGDMLLEQACDLAGITIRGQQPVLSEERRRTAAEEDAILDWSGRTTYWYRDLQVTPEGGQKFFDALVASCSDILLLELWWDSSSVPMKRRYRLLESLSQCRNLVTFGVGADTARLNALLARDHVPVAELANAFPHTIGFFQFHWNDPTFRNAAVPYFIDETERNLTFAGAELRGRLATQFATADPMGMAFVQKVVAAADACFFESDRNRRSLDGRSHRHDDASSLAQHRFSQLVSSRARTISGVV